MRQDLTDTVAMLKERRGTRRKRRRFDPTGVPLEHEEQANLIAWKFAMMRQIPELEMLFAIPGQGVGRLKNLQIEGYAKGLPDMMLAVPIVKSVERNLVWAGLFIELKRVRGGKVSPFQYDWMERLTNQGYKCVVARGCAEAQAAILEYLGKA